MIDERATLWNCRNGLDRGKACGLPLVLELVPADESALDQHPGKRVRCTKHGERFHAFQSGVARSKAA
jgi:hypothetical protein